LITVRELVARLTESEASIQTNEGLNGLSLLMHALRQ
jgi:hypothetical protein